MFDLSEHTHLSQFWVTFLGFSTSRTKPRCCVPNTFYR